MAAALEQLVKVRSQLSTWLVRYLRILIELPNRDTPPYLAGRQMIDLYVPPDVLKEQGRGNQDRERTSWRGMASLGEEGQWRFRHDNDKRTRVAWERERKTIRHAVILGRPGEGKTLLAKMSIRALAEASLADLTAQQKGLRDVPIPVCLQLADVVKNGSVEAAVKTSLRRSLKDSYPKEKDSPIIELVIGYILDALFTDRCWLFLDALDEVHDRTGLKTSLEPLCRTGCHVVVTTRPYSYDKSILPFTSMTEYELAPFTSRQRREFLGNWFKDDAVRRAHVVEILQGDPQFGDLTRNALLLTLTCATAECHDALPDEARRIDLYRLIVPDMVRGIWKDNTLAADDPRISVMLRLLQRVAWELFLANPARAAFTDDELMDAIERTNGSSSAEWLEQTVRELRATGLLISPASGQRMFLHRTILEYLVAEHISRQAEPLTHAERFLWQPDKDGILRWQPAAAEVICFLAGCMDDPGILLRRLIQLDEEQRDQFRTMLLLAGQGLANAHESKIDEGLAKTITEEVFELWLHPPLGLTRHHIISGLAHQRGVYALTAVVNDRISISRKWYGTGLLGDESYSRCEDVVEALGVIGSERAVEVLITLMQTDRYLKFEAARALNDIGSEQAIEALEEIGGQQAVGAFILQFDPDEYRVELVRSLAGELGAIGTEVSVETLIELMQNNEDANVRRKAAEVLGLMRNQVAVGPLVGRLQNDESLPVICYALKALGLIGSDAAVKPLIEYMQNNREAWVRAWTAEALGMIGSEVATEALIDRMQNDTDRNVRHYATVALGPISRRAGRWIPTTI